MRERVEEVIDKIRPHLQMDGGDVELVDVNEETGQVRLRLIGACAGCMMSQMTLKMGIERSLKQYVPEISEVVAI